MWGEVERSKACRSHITTYMNKHGRIREMHKDTGVHIDAPSQMMLFRHSDCQEWIHSLTTQVYRRSGDQGPQTLIATHRHLETGENTAHRLKRRIHVFKSGAAPMPIHSLSQLL